MAVNVKLGSNTITGVSSVKLESADTAGTYETFSLPQWEEVDCGGTNTSLDWEAWVIIDQEANLMGASCTVTIMGYSKTVSDESIRYYHFVNIPINTAIYWSGTGDYIKASWAKQDAYGNVDANVSTTNSSTTVKISTSIRGRIMLTVGSPET